MTPVPVPKSGEAVILMIPLDILGDREGRVPPSLSTDFLSGVVIVYDI
jgi:hypothetical protein